VPTYAATVTVGDLSIKDNWYYAGITKVAAGYVWVKIIGEEDCPDTKLFVKPTTYGVTWTYVENVSGSVLTNLRTHLEQEAQARAKADANLFGSDDDDDDADSSDDDAGAADSSDDAAGAADSSDDD
jgi:hypothetical protein